MLISQLELETGIQIQKPEHVHATEWFRDSQAELQVHPGSPTCIFADIESFFMPSIRNVINELKAKGKTISLQNLLPVIHSKRAVCPKGHCVKHGKVCKIRPQ